MINSLKDKNGKFSARKISRLSESERQKIIIQNPNLKSNNLTEHLYWIENNLSDYPKSCLKCGNKIIYFNRFSNPYSPNYCCLSCMRSSHFDKVGRKEKIKKTLEEKEKIISKQKRIETSLKRYGTEYPWQNSEIKNKKDKTMIERYGVKSPFQIEYVRNKIKEKNLKRYGVENVSLSCEIKQKKKQTSLKRYGTEYPWQNLEINQKKKCTYNKTIRIRLSFRFNRIYEKETVIPLFSQDEYFGILMNYKWKCKICEYEFKSNLDNGKIVKCPKCKPKSRPQFEVYEFIKDELKIENILYDDRTQIYPKEIDIYLPDYKLGIEMNGVYWHRDDDLSIKTKLCEEIGITLLHVSDVEWNEERDRIKEHIKRKIGVNK